MTIKEKFKSFLLDTVLPNNKSYLAWFNANNIDLSLTELALEYSKAFRSNLFDIDFGNKDAAIALIQGNLKNKKETTFELYNSSKGSGIPNAIVNSHFVKFIQYFENEIEFKLFQDLINLIHKEISANFIRKFQQQRIQLNGNSRVGSNSVLFGEVRDNYWTINIGAGKEIQYHMFCDGKKLGYGLAFNAKASQNNRSPIEVVKPFIQSYRNNSNIKEQHISDYEFIVGNESNLLNIDYGDFVCIGKRVSIRKDLNETLKIDGLDLLRIVYDLKGKQFEAYKLIFKGRNKILIRKDKDNMHSELLKYKKQIILQGPPGTGKTYTAKDIAYNMIYDNNVSTVSKERKKQIKELEKTDQYKLIQFHPAYTYEDFVRGITAKATGKGIEYITENRVLGEFSKEALDNYLDSLKSKEQLSKAAWLGLKLDEYVLDLEKRFKDQNYSLNNSSVRVREISRPNHFFLCKYDGDGGDGFKVKFEDVKSLYLQIMDVHIIDIDLTLNNNNNYHRKIIIPLLADFRSFLEKAHDVYEEKPLVIMKNFVLIIDEMNRANLPAVLGELIYALEYRGEAVDSMYELKGSRKLILPPNLYIIGTMNTADRSVGHIDYAIRRRFAFVDLLPKASVVKEHGGENALRLFNEVSSLFIKDDGKSRSDKLSPEFNPEDVMIGHSYFLEKNDDDLKMRLKYEIKPILKEYVKDGILLESAKEIISELNV